MTAPNQWSDFLNVDDTGRRAGYFSYGDQFGGQGSAGGGQRQRTYYQDAFSDLYNKYLGTLGLQARQGQEPRGEWSDYLSGFDWDRNYQESVPYGQRNQGQGGFVPGMRWDVLRR
jgi:hypothetical protein